MLPWRLVTLSLPLSTHSHSRSPVHREYLEYMIIRFVLVHALPLLSAQQMRVPISSARLIRRRHMSRLYYHCSYGQPPLQRTRTGFNRSGHILDNMAALQLAAFVSERACNVDKAMISEWTLMASATVITNHTGHSRKRNYSY